MIHPPPPSAVFVSIRLVVVILSAGARFSWCVSPLLVARVFLDGFLHALARLSLRLV